MAFCQIEPNDVKNFIRHWIPRKAKSSIQTKTEIAETSESHQDTASVIMRKKFNSKTRQDKSSPTTPAAQGKGQKAIDEQSTVTSFLGGAHDAKDYWNKHICGKVNKKTDTPYDIEQVPVDFIKGMKESTVTNLWWQQDGPYFPHFQQAYEREFGCYNPIVEPSENDYPMADYMTNRQFFNQYFRGPLNRKCMDFDLNEAHARGFLPNLMMTQEELRRSGPNNTTNPYYNPALGPMIAAKMQKQQQAQQQQNQAPINNAHQFYRSVNNNNNNNNIPNNPQNTPKQKLRPTKKFNRYFPVA